MKIGITVGLAWITFVVAAHGAEMGGTGVWIVDRKNDSEPLRTGEVLPKSPAEKAGVKPNWYLISVNGTNVVKISFKESMRVMRGPVGSTVTLELADPGRTITNKFTLKRGKAIIENGSVVGIIEK